MKHTRRPLLIAAALAASGASADVITEYKSPLQTMNGLYGISVAGLRDINNDKHGDVAIGAMGEKVGAHNGAGRVHLYSGFNNNYIRTLTSAAPEASGQFGYSVSGIADQNGDGRGEVLVGAPGETVGPFNGAGRAYMFSGINGALLRIFTSPGKESFGNFGASISSVEDVNGDNFRDVVVGAPSEDPGTSPSGCGRAYVFSGKTGALIHKLLPAFPALGGNFGFSVRGMPDINGDNRGEIIVGAPGETYGGIGAAGRVYVFSGATGKPLRILGSPGKEAGGSFGTSVSWCVSPLGLGILVGAPYEDPGASPSNCGRAYTYHAGSGALRLKILPQFADENGNFGISVDWVDDVDEDDDKDLIVGGHRVSVTGTLGGYVGVHDGDTGLPLGFIESLKDGIGGEFGWKAARIPVPDGVNSRLIIGAPGESPGAAPNFAGRAYRYEFSR